MNIVLCGLPGSGKSTLGKLLGNVIEIDALIEKKEGMTCRQLFAEKGEAYFREIERQIIADLVQNPPKNVVISLGGGVTDPNIQNLGIVVYLKANTDTLFKRISPSASYLDPKDPKGSFEKIAAKRIPRFQELADIEIDVEGLTPEQIAKRIKFPIYLGMKPLLKVLKSFESSQYAIITDSSVAPLYGKPLEDFLKQQGLQVTLITFPAGEDHKTRETKEYCENQLLKLGAGRDTCIIGLGGGVVTDLVGFVAATYCRGVPIVMIPTTLLGMVDASIGGKTGVNVPEGKNLIGVIRQPNAIFIDSTKLKTLPLSEIKNGISEMIKHSLIVDQEYFNFLKTNAKQLLALDIPLMNKAIWDSILIKTAIVEEDEKETGKRRLLNLGHTFAHAIETATKHTIPHGKAVAIGTIAESHLSMKMGHLSLDDFEQICQIFSDFEMDLTWENERDFLPFMQLDKKSLNKKPRFVILKEIGKPLEFNGEYCTPFTDFLEFDLLRLPQLDHAL